MSKMTSAILAIALTGCFAPPPIGGEGDLIDSDGDGFTADVDCNDTVASVNPDATEICDSVDNDCDGLADEGCETPVDTDVDNDGYHVPADCNDNNAGVHPGATEICDGLDNNCSGGSDEGLKTPFYADVDNDGYGWNTLNPVMACGLLDGFVENNLDCNDANATTRPGQYEVCNDTDDNCDGFVDNLPGGATCDPNTDTCFRDADGDGQGTSSDTRVVAVGAMCPTGYIRHNHDCDDSRPTVFNGAEESCNQRDDNCDDVIDEDNVCAPVCTPTGAEICGNTVDEDCSGGANACPVCIPTGPEVCGNGVNEDCNASTSDTCPVCVVTGPELCGNSRDDDCNATTSDICPVTPTKACYEDRDNDGYGANGRVTQRTTCLSSEAEVAGDCEDGDALRFPELMEVLDLRDNDCDGKVDEDGLVIYNRYYRTPGVDWDHLHALTTPAGGYSADGKQMGLYPTSICSGTYRPFDTCTVNATTVTLHGGNQLEAVSQCRGFLDGKDATLLLLEGDGSGNGGAEFRDYSTRSGFACSRLGYAMSETGSARHSFGIGAWLLWRHRSAPFNAFGVARAGVADNMWSILPLEGAIGHGGTSADLDYDEHTTAFYVPFAR